MKTAKMIAGLALTSMLFAASAQAATPKLKNTLIVPNKSVGALKLGMSATAAKAAWGAGKCETSGLCQFGARPTPSAGYAAYAVNTLTAGTAKTVLTITLEAGPFGKPKRNYSTPLARFKTSKGIGLGSTKAALLRAYPHMTNEQPNFYIIPQSESVETIFGLEAGRVDLIAIGAHG
ncbi:MAG TPA: hypothetical protein VH061_14875 [Solirubrobacteraceae bacterium]|jgi:hypothetical protein|nr:hypothetical protein [Solirubrobacteraceae bacterium]